MRPLRRVLETVLYAEDLDAAERFYGDVLGLQLDSRKAGVFGFFRVGHGMLLLFDPRAARQSRRPGARCHGRGPCLLRRGRGRARRLEGAPEVDGHRHRARADLAARRPLVLFPRSRRQQHRARDAAHLGPGRRRCHDRRGPGPARRPCTRRRARSGPPAPRPGAQVRFVADLVCPWCYIAFLRLQALAAAARPAWSGTRSCSTRTCRPTACRAPSISSASSDSVAQAPGRAIAAAPAGGLEACRSPSGDQAPAEHGGGARPGAGAPASARSSCARRPVPGVLPATAATSATPRCWPGLRAGLGIDLDERPAARSAGARCCGARARLPLGHRRRAGLRLRRRPRHRRRPAGRGCWRRCWTSSAIA